MRANHRLVFVAEVATFVVFPAVICGCVVFNVLRAIDRALNAAFDTGGTT